MPKVSAWQPAGRDKDVLWVFFCEGCKCLHHFDSRWKFNGDVDRPTFFPSLIVSPDSIERRCHLIIKNGKIEYLSDCHHILAGKTFEMEDHKE
jgi:hypothetical protein